MAAHQITLRAEPGSVPRARRFVEQVLVGWGLDDLVWTATLLVSELTTNACLHARTPMTVTLERTETGAVRLGVDDGSAVAPQMRHYAEEATTGRGMRLVASLSTRSGVQPLPQGKSVWVELVPARDGARDDDEQDVEDLLDRFRDDVDVLPAREPPPRGRAATTPRGRAA
jgi:anti-sigma regulatory factor (Ser/Thr protein kinase)